MESWNDFQQRYRTLKRQDPEGARTAKRDFLASMQRTVSSLESEFESQKSQLSEQHQQRINSHLLLKKRQAREKFIYVLSQTPTKAKRVERALHKYIRVEEKDRQHSINHYRHLLNSDGGLERAQNVEQNVLAHLSDVDKRIEDAIRLQHERLPKARLAKQIEKRVRAFWRDLRGAEWTRDDAQLLRHMRFEAESDRENHVPPSGEATTRK